MSGISRPKHPIARNDALTAGVLQIGDRVKVFLDSNFWMSAGWFEGTILRIDPYSAHRSFYWVELDTTVRSVQGGLTNLVSVLNLKNIKRLD